MTGPAPLAELLHRGDHAGLVVEIDRRASRGDWDGLFLVRDRCREAAQVAGRQLWGAAQYAEYRIALDAPGPRAAAVLHPGAARFALGPLTEVVAQHHRWEELADHLSVPVVAATVAQERVLRGEDLTGDARAHADELELPLRLQPWEPSYPLPSYRADEVLEGHPPARDDGATLDADVAPGRPTTAPAVEAALHELVAQWTEASTGEAHVVVVEGDAPAAVAALVSGEVSLRTVGLPDAFARMAWAGGSGGRHGRRRGMAAGRSSAWWAGHALAQLAFPAPPDELEWNLEELDWYVFDDRAPDGWQLRLAVGHPTEGWAAAIDAFDLRTDDRRGSGTGTAPAP